MLTFFDDRLLILLAVVAGVTFTTVDKDCIVAANDKPLIGRFSEKALR